ncbi:MAG: hypothetical protein K2M42_00150 [Oscillospiraceae bacterium]|nr:hypothetical protein [Oscillospiraceae bacterium]
MGTKYMLLGIVLCLCGIVLAAFPSPVAWVFAGGGLLLALIGLFKEG